MRKSKGAVLRASKGRGRLQHDVTQTLLDLFTKDTPKGAFRSGICQTQDDRGIDVWMAYVFHNGEIASALSDNQAEAVECAAMFRRQIVKVAGEPDKQETSCIIVPRDGPDETVH